MALFADLTVMINFHFDPANDRLAWTSSEQDLTQRIVFIKTKNDSKALSRKYRIYDNIRKKRR